jgi:hypothetical protein
MTKKITISLLVFLILIVPVISLAYTSGDPLVPCTDSGSCDFDAFMTLINNVISFILYDMVIPIAAIMFAYAGFLLVTSAGSSGAKTKMKSVFTNTVLGLIFAVGAFLIIRTILSILGYEGSWIGF